MAEEEEISLSTIITFLLVAGAIVWKLFLSPSESPANSGYSGMSRGAMRDTPAIVQARESMAERLLQMFPQVDRRAVLWDLRSNGNQIQETTERILSGSLETPPVTFQPAPPASQAQPTLQPKPASKKDHQDLITRYRLQEKVAMAASAPEEPSTDSPSGAKPSAKAWSSNREERQALLLKRREEMIIKARRQMQQKLAAGKESS